MKPETLETHNPDLFSQVRRNLNSLKEVQTSKRKDAIADLIKIVKQQQLSGILFEEIMHMANKDLLKIISDSSQFNREHSLILIIQLLPRCNRITPFLPYIFAVLIDRTNCNDLEGINNMPEKMRPAPGQKPKVISKLIENCQQIRLLYCTLMKKILSLVEENEIRDKLDEIVNILRALIMDPSPEIQKAACETMEFFCKAFKLVLLHYTQIMGRAVLLPLVSKKSKIRIAGLNTLTAILYCGIWKYNAFIFQNLIGFRDPNSVPIKDFYQPSNNINYFATFVNDQNVKVRQQFMRHIKIWTCDLDDKYDHHGRIVPYIISGLFDKDDIVRETAIQIIVEIGKQIQVEKEKQFRESKQFAIDAAWTWEGKLIGLPVEPPLKQRPSLGSRVFIRGHVRKFWSALYKQIKDIHFQNKVRAAYLMLYGTIFTENYMSQYLDVMLPHLLSSVIPISIEDKQVSLLIQKTIFYLGRYCESSSYIHIMASALKGELIQNQNFLKSTIVGLSKLIEGAFQAIPEGTGLCHKKQQIEQLINLFDQCSIYQQIYRGNSIESLNLVSVLLNGFKSKASSGQTIEILDKSILSLIKLFAVSYYECCYSQLIANEANVPEKSGYSYLKQQFDLIAEIYPQYFEKVQEFMEQSYLNPPSLMDSDWKLIIVIHNLLTQATLETENTIFVLAQEVICESLTKNRSIEILTFIYKYVPYLFKQVPDKHKLSKLHSVVSKSLQNFSIFKPMKKVPVYDQHLVQPETDPSIIRINEDIFLPLFKNCSETIQSFYLNKIAIPLNELSKIIYFYITISKKFIRDKSVVLESIKTLWIIFERAQLKVQSCDSMVYQEKGEKEENRFFIFQLIIDYLIQRLETLGEPDQARLNMIFDILQFVVKCCPKIPNVMTKLPSFYLDYPHLLQKLFKYALDEKDADTRQKYQLLLISLCNKLRPWFELQAKISEQSSRFARANLLKIVLEKSK